LLLPTSSVLSFLRRHSTAGRCLRLFCTTVKC
jgi:hypothetical protein